MIDEKVVATIAVVLRGDTDTIRGGVENLPRSIEIVQIVHNDGGVTILTNAEMAALQQGFYNATRGITRKKLRRFYKAERNGGRDVPTEPTSPSVTGQEAKP
jgi:hypothetical protein